MTQRPESRQPLPADAVQVFEGRVFDVFQWEQVLFDGTITTFEKARRPDTVSLLPVCDGRIRIARLEQPGVVPSYGLIGGRVERRESPVEAAHRELAEEGGLVASSVELWDASQSLPKVDWATYIFIAWDCRPVVRAADPGERVELADVTFEQLLELVATEAFGDALVALRLLRLAADPDRRAAMREVLLRTSEPPGMA